MNWSYLSYQADKLFRSPAYVERQQDSTESNQTGEPNMLTIPSVGISAPIVESKDNTEKEFQEALKTGVVHYPGTAQVGELGNAYIFGHSSDLTFKSGDYKTIFAPLPDIKKDAEILVTNGSGQQFRYVVFEQFVTKSDDVQLLSQDTKGEKILTLQTSYPIGTALKRYIVKAKLSQ